MRLNALFRLAFAAPTSHDLSLPHRVTRRSIMQKVRSRTGLLHSASTACRLPVSGTISLPSLGCFSPFPHGTCSLSVTREYLALEGGPPRFRQGSTCLVLLGIRLAPLCFRLPGYHRLWPLFPKGSTNKRATCRRPTTPIHRSI